MILTVLQDRWWFCSLRGGSLLKIRLRVKSRKGMMYLFLNLLSLFLLKCLMLMSDGYMRLEWDSLGWRCKYILYWILSSTLFFIFWWHYTACGILLPQPGIEPTSRALEAWGLNHWTTKKVSTIVFNSQQKRILHVSLLQWSKVEGIALEVKLREDDPAKVTEHMGFKCSSLTEKENSEYPGEWMNCMSSSKMCDMAWERGSVCLCLLEKFSKIN